MRVVLDTNVLVSALLFTGTVSEFVSLWQKGTITVLLSREILEEYLRDQDAYDPNLASLTWPLTVDFLARELDNF